MLEKLEKIYTFGALGGQPFQDQQIREIGLSAGDWIDALYLNGHRYGGHHGRDTPRLVLESDEFIDSIDIRYGSRIDYLRFSTNKGRWIEGGGNGGTAHPPFRDIRLLGIAGRSAVYLDRIELRMLIDSTIHPKPSF
ncbi:jacalin-like lectin [Neorhizobium sp. IRS_2294]|uniref:jacalin-like lectin n=1 Tax=unclassified Neorhizobium TaxID=2629175 RepID=UPI003D28C924